MFSRLSCLLGLGLVSILEARDCGYVQTDSSPSGFAALDTCGEYSFSTTITLPGGGTVTRLISTSFRYECNSDDSEVILYTWTGLGNCTTIAEADTSEVISDDEDDFNCGPDNCAALVTLQESSGTGCESLTETFLTYPYLTGYCVYYTNDDDQYSEFYTCTDDSLIYEQYNTSQSCAEEPYSETELVNACASVSVTVAGYTASGSYLFTVDDCNNAYDNGINYIMYSLGAISTVWTMLK